MKKRDKFKLTENEKKVLKQVIEHGKISDTDIAEKLPISQQAVNQIRSRLEDIGIIEGYSPIINYDKIGVNLICFMGINISDIAWQKYSEADFNKFFLEFPALFQAYRVSSTDISYILIFGFKGKNDEEKIVKKMETFLSREINVVWLYSISTKNILATDSLNLIYHSLEDSNVNLNQIFQKFKKN